MIKINYNVLNTLNMMSCQLGNAYLEKGYNPFEENFLLNEDFAQKLIENKKLKENIIIPDFLKKSNKQIKQYFETSINNSKLLLQNLDFKQINPLANVFLKNRIELLKISISKLKFKSVNVLKLYKEIYGISPKLSEIMANSYFENFNLETAITQFINFANELSKIIDNSPKIEHAKIREKIQANNKKSNKEK